MLREGDYYVWLMTASWTALLFALFSLTQVKRVFRKKGNGGTPFCNGNYLEWHRWLRSATNSNPPQEVRSRYLPLHRGVQQQAENVGSSDAQASGSTSCTQKLAWSPALTCASGAV